MADVKISALPAATIPLAGTEVLPIVQGGTTDRVSVANLTAGRAISATELTLSTGNLIQGTAAKGINFTANTPAATMTSQLLNWYEEGNWTPVISSAAGTITSYSVNSASYTRIGRRVIVDFDITITNNGTGTAGINITGVPFAVATAYASCGSFREVAVTGNVGAIIANSGTNLQAANYDNAYAGGTNYRLIGTFSYNA